MWHGPYAPEILDFIVFLLALVGSKDKLQKSVTSLLVTVGYQKCLGSEIHVEKSKLILTPYRFLY